ncbi:MAG: hypothetical protein IKF06_09485 [Lachnospiraceae bacterium]|nr:hypothetical protein [Lachnospiraceae bacterium]MBR2843488.1 hypothetical protein [Lachnospiraceae bacterium]MBR3361787.1 hypothetical protein [Lachnospiraceae bacterium]
MVISLKWKDRTLMAAVARITQNMIAAQDLGVDRAQIFWRISMYAKIGLLKKQDVRDILTAMEAFSVILKKQPFRDPNGDFADIDGVIGRLTALMAKKGVEPTQE